MVCDLRAGVPALAPRAVAGVDDCRAVCGRRWRDPAGVSVREPATRRLDTAAVAPIVALDVMGRAVCGGKGERATARAGDRARADMGGAASSTLLWLAP